MPVASLTVTKTSMANIPDGPYAHACSVYPARLLQRR